MSRTRVEIRTDQQLTDDLADLLFAVEPATGQGTRPLYFADEVPAAGGNGGRQKAANKPIADNVPGTKPS